MHACIFCTCVWDMRIEVSFLYVRLAAELPKQTKKIDINLADLT